MVLPGLGSIDEEGSGGRPGIEDIEIEVKSTTLSVPAVALVIHRRGPSVWCGGVHSAAVSRPYEEKEQVRGSHTITLHWYNNVHSNQQEESIGVHGGPPGGQYHHLLQEGLGVHGGPPGGQYHHFHHGGPPGVHGRPLGGEYHHFQHCSAAPAYYHARLTLGSIVHIKHKKLFSFQRQI